jgi:hypothetical protein
MAAVARKAILVETVAKKWKHLLSAKQGDQIGRTLASFICVNFNENPIKSPNFWTNVFHSTRYVIKFDKI